MNIGVRYSPETMIANVRHVELQLLNPPYGQTWTPENTSTATNPSLKNWDPRIGLAYDPFSDHKTSIRAGFGIFHNVIYSRDLNMWLQPPFLIATQARPVRTSEPARQLFSHYDSRHAGSHTDQRPDQSAELQRLVREQYAVSAAMEFQYSTRGLRPIP